MQTVQSEIPDFNLDRYLMTLYKEPDRAAHLEKLRQYAPRAGRPSLGKCAEAGLLLLKPGNERAALSLLNEAIALNRNLKHAWQCKGYVLCQLNMLADALVAFTEAAGLEPIYGLPFFDVGQVYWRLGRFDEAARAFERVIHDEELEPEYREAADCWISRAKQMMELKNKGGGKQGKDEFFEACELFEEIKGDLPEIRRRRRQFDERMKDALGSPKIGTEGADDLLVILQDWNSFSPILRRDLREQDHDADGKKTVWHDPGPRERLGGGYFLVWKGHGTAIDPGVDFVSQLYHKGFSIADVDSVVVTHCHLDHTRDLESLVDLRHQYKEAQKEEPGKKEPSELKFWLCPSAHSRYSKYLQESQACSTPGLLERNMTLKLTDFVDVSAVPAEHKDINNRSDEAIGLIFDLKADKDTPITRVGITSDTKWFDSLPNAFNGCKLLVAHLGTVEAVKRPPDENEVPYGDGFPRTILPNHLGTKGCLRLLREVKPTLFVLSEFGEELVQVRFKIFQFFNKLKPDDTDIVLCGDSNLAIGLGKDLSICCSHPLCKKWHRIPLKEVDPMQGGDYLFEYFCRQHGYKRPIKPLYPGEDVESVPKPHKRRLGSVGIG